MKKYFSILLTAALVIIAMSSCKKSFDDLYENPNKPNSVPSSLLLRGVLNDIYEGPAGMKERWSQYYCINYDYYGNNRYDFGSGDEAFNPLPLSCYDRAAERRSPR